MPLQLWVQAARAGLRIKEVGVPRLYLDPNRAFGGVLDDAAERLTYYRGVIAAAEAAVVAWSPDHATTGTPVVHPPQSAPCPFGLFPKRTCH